MADVKILLVEDENVEALDIKRTLESFGYDVPYVASSGEEAVEKALAIMPDIILMDIVLKGNTDGIEAVSEIKDLNIPIIYLTAHSEESTIERAKLTEPYGYIIKPYDRTELKHAIELAIYKNQMEKELKESEERYSLTVEAVNEGIWDWNVPTGEAYFSPIYYKMLGYDDEDFPASYESFKTMVHPDDIERVEKELQYHIDNVEGYAIELRLKTKNGKWLWILTKGKVVETDKDGNPIRMVGTHTDITKRKQAEEERDRFFNLSLDMMGIAGFDGYFKQLNPAWEKTLGWTNKELMSKPYMEFVHRDDKEATQNAAHSLAEGLKIIEFINRYQCKDGSYKWLSWKSYPLSNENLIYTVARDITSWKEAQESLQKSEKKHRIMVEELKNTENTLKESEKSYRELVDNSLVGIYKTNLQGDLLFVNDAMAKIFYYDNIDELKENNIIKLYKNSEDRLQFINKLKKDGHVTDYELETRGKNGQCINMLVSASLKDDILSGMFMDISQLKRAEKNLLEGEKRFRTLINSSTDLINILDKNGYIIFDSPSCTKILGYPDGSLIGKSPLEFIHPDDLERVKNDLAEVYENRNTGIPTEFRIRKADGEYLHVESISQNMIHVPNIEGIVVTTHPIQQRKEMEDTLRESEEKYRTLFETDPDYTLLIGTDGIIQDVNKATSDITGLSREELIGKHFIELELAIPEDIPVYVENITQILKGEQIKTFESQFMDKNGKIRWGFITLTPIIKDKSISSIMAIISDFTDRKVAENQLKTIIKEKEVLLREIHHRVKNNMQIISSLLNLQTQHVEGKETINVLKESQGRVKSLAMIHEKLYQSPTFTDINFKEYIRKLVSDIFYSYGITTGTIESVLNIEDININIDTAIPLGLIINELITNSVKYAFPKCKGKITLKLKSSQEQMELTITDDGIGIPKDIDIENTETLGLQLVKNLINQLDGTLKLNTDKGTEFKITFNELEV
jgi:PAS domain S-box-containing protein